MSHSVQVRWSEFILNPLKILNVHNDVHRTSTRRVNEKNVVYLNKPCAPTKLPMLDGKVLFQF